MGEYFNIINLDKKQYLYSHIFGTGLKYYEIIGNDLGPLSALGVLIGTRDIGPLSGSWKGDRIVMAGDYYGDISLLTKEEVDLYQEQSGCKIDSYYFLCEKFFTNISVDILYEMCESDFIFEEIIQRYIKTYKGSVLEEAIDSSPKFKEMVDEYLNAHPELNARKNRLEVFT